MSLHMSRYVNFKDIAHTVVPKRTSELLNTVTTGVDTVNSTLFGGNDPSYVTRDIRPIALRKPTRTIADFNATDYYYHEDTEYNVESSKSFRLVRYPGQEIDVTNTGSETIKVYVCTRLSTNAHKQKTYYVQEGTMITFH